MRDSSPPTNAPEDDTTNANVQDAGKARFRGNVVANLSGFVLRTGIGLWFTPYLIANLGVAGYGLVPLALQIPRYMSLLTVALSGSVGRFLTMDIARGDTGSANKTFNTALFASLFLSVTLLPISAGVAYMGPSFLNVPEGHEAGARWLLMGAMLSFLMGTVTGVFGVSTFSHSRFDIRTAIEMLGVILRTGVVVVLFSLLQPALLHVALGTVAVAVVAQAGNLWAWKRLTPELHIQRSCFDRSRLRAQLEMGGWLVVGQLGTLLFLNIDLLVVNMVVGAEAGGRYAPTLQWSMLLRTFAGLISGVLTPTIIARHAQQDHEAVIEISRKAVRLLGVLIALPTGLVCGFSEPLLSQWLGKDFASVAPLLCLLTAPLCINLAVLPLFSINVATNRVRWPGLVTVGLGLVNFGLAIILAGKAGWGVYGVAAAGAIVLTAKNAAYTPLYAAHVLGRRLHTFLWCMAPSVLGTAVVAGLAIAFQKSYNIASWTGLIIGAVAVSLVYAPLAYFVLLRRRERITLRELVLRRNRGLE